MDTWTAIRMQKDTFNDKSQRPMDLRVAVFGAAAVGKSSLVQRFIKGAFKETYTTTVEDCYRKVLNCDKAVFTLEVIDTSGSMRFPAMQRLSVQRSHAFVLVYSVCSRSSLLEVDNFYEEIISIRGNDPGNIPICLAAAKCDLPQREVSEMEGRKVAERLHCLYIETSAKLDHNVSELFEQLGNQCKVKVKSESPNPLQHNRLSVANFNLTTDNAKKGNVRPTADTAIKSSKQSGKCVLM